ncbi:HAD family hydrolase [uncultured Selenomonas sp.]|uniref:D-glycero-alpha-D-manno-heptose-1,7-bisphosphate 7-phosphatase n=1 Tax=uncultured Selenomonas sp. TaxID=159275 RepID=UPI0025CE7B53|nr:HAD family hydrolase [uncultured Selenomonas sp.]
MRQRKAVFFDRDGTLNVDVHYLHRPEDFEWLPGAREAIKYVNDAGFLAIVITNQSGVARGYFPESDVLRVYDWMNEDLESLGAHLDALYYCPHHPHGSVPEYTKDCTCRKPKPGLVLQAIEEHHIDPAASVLIGDGDRDVECAERAGVRGVKYEGGSLLEVVKRALHLFSIPSN